MTGGACHKPGYERGAWFELKCLRETIANIEAHGGDASFERKLYRAWLRDPDYAKTDQENQRRGIYGKSASVADKQGAVTNKKQRESYQRQDVTANNVSESEYKGLNRSSEGVLQDITARCRQLAGEGKSTRAIAAILEAEGIAISHMTVARKLQAVMV